MGRASRRKRGVTHRDPLSEKLSERLLQLVAPFRDIGMEQPEYETLLRFASVAWNLSLLSTEKRREAVAGAFAEFAPDVRSSMLTDLEELLDRKATLFPDDHRLIADVRVTDLGGGRVNVTVASAS